MAELTVPLVVTEATGGLERPLAQRLSAAGIAVAVVNPRHIRQFAKGLGWLAKTDRLDAAMIARYGALDRQIAATLAAQPDASERAAILASVPGVGPVATSALLALLPELGRRDGKAIAALAGLAPIAQDSGKRRGQRRIQGGRGVVRCALYMATLVASRHNPVIRAFYQRLRASGKAPKLALTAAMRKLLVILNAMLRDGTSWNPHHLATTNL